MGDSAYQRMIIGYHGCRADTAEEVLLRGAMLDQSDNDWDWLGHGIYFWEFGPERAWEWARRKFDEDAAVLGAYINLGRCFDLTDRRHTAALGKVFEAFIESLDGGVPPVNDEGFPHDEDLVKRHLDCAVINYAMEFYDQQAKNRQLVIATNDTYYQSVRGIFVEGDEAFAGSMIRERTHVQVAMRDPEMIVGYFRPSEE